MTDPNESVLPTPDAGEVWRGRIDAWSRRAGALDPTVQGLLWSAAAGVAFALLNTTMRGLTLQMDPFQSQFLRYLASTLVLMPLLLRDGLAAYWPNSVRGQFARGGLHTIGLMLWFAALPKIPLADMTAIGFTGPIFIMLGAWVFFREPMRWERWLAAGVGFAGVMVVVAPKMSAAGGVHHLMMLASSPVFAASFLLTKALTRHESTGVIVAWQSFTVMVLSIPLAIWHWQWPTAWQCVGFLVCGALGSLGHYALTRSYRVADISSTQSVKFLDLVWATLLGWLAFGDTPSTTTLIGGVIICASTLWIAHREARQTRAAAA